MLLYNSKQEKLMPMSPVKRTISITYFMSDKTRVKLDAAHRLAFSKVTETIQELKGKRSTWSASLLVSSMCDAYEACGSDYRRRVYCGYFPRFLYSNHAETKFMFEGHLLQNLTLNYQFTLFDFENSKKEA